MIQFQKDGRFLFGAQAPGPKVVTCCLEEGSRLTGLVPGAIPRAVSIQGGPKA